MRHLLEKLSKVDMRWRWAALAVAVLVVGVAGWFFFLREPEPAPGPGTVAPARPAVGKVVAYADYLAALDEALAHVQDARDTSGDERQRGVRDAIAALERIEGASVAIPGGSGPFAEIDNTLLLEQLRAEEPYIVGVESGLSALVERLRDVEVQGYLPGTMQGAEATAELRQVLADPVFDYESRLSPLQRLARWLSELAGEGDPDDVMWRLVSALLMSIVVGVVTYLASDRIPNRWARLGLALLAALLTFALAYASLGVLDATFRVLGVVGIIVAVIAALIIFKGVGRSSAPSARPPAISELAAVLGMNSAEARRRATESASEGDFRGALRYRCLAVLLTLDEAGRLRFDRSATDREYLFRAPESLQGDLQPLLSRFEAVWYGTSPTSAEEWQSYNANAASVEARVTAEARAEDVRGRSAA